MPTYANQVTTPATGDRQLDIRRRIVSAPAIFQRKMWIGNSGPDPDPLKFVMDPAKVPDPSYSSHR